MVILVVGPNHSGTSYVTKLLIDHGADPGQYDASTGPSINYVKYENTEFKTFLVYLLKIQTDIVIDPQIDYEARFRSFVASLDPNQTYVFKYPRALFALSNLRDIFGPDLRVVYVSREVEAWLDSHQRRSGGTQDELMGHLNECVTALMLYTGPVLKVSFEELMQGRGVYELCRYAGLAK